jgi:hypothetical protein
MDSMVKDAGAVIDYAKDWADWLAGDTITNTEWFVENPTGAPDDLVVYSQFDKPTTPTMTTVWLAGGAPGSIWIVTNRISTAAGRTQDHSMRVLVRQL